jgi:transmembrane sensor
MIEYYDKEELELQISNYLSGNSTDEEKETLLAFLASNEAAARTFREMSAVWALSSVPSFAEIENSNLVRIKERMTAPASSKPVRKLIPVWLKVAAVILLIGCNYFWYTYTENLTEVYTNADSPYEIKVPAGSRTNIVLPDGTEVSLNAGSVLRYHRGFGIRERNVTLDGEGYFKVAKNAEVPFFVKTNDVQVQVVGTVFNVRAYDDDNYVMVSLLEGRVNLSASANSVMKLFPNEQALYNKNTGRMEKLKTNASKACDWLDGGLTFENASFADIAHRLERKFQVKISIESERLKAEHFSGSFDSNQNIYDILHEINVEKQYTWKVSGDTIFITDKRKGVR